MQYRVIWGAHGAFLKESLPYRQTILSLYELLCFFNATQITLFAYHDYLCTHRDKRTKQVFGQNDKTRVCCCMINIKDMAWGKLGAFFHTARAITSNVVLLSWHCKWRLLKDSYISRVHLSEMLILDNRAYPLFYFTLLLILTIVQCTIYLLTYMRVFDLAFVSTYRRNGQIKPDKWHLCRKRGVWASIIAGFHYGS